MSNKKRTEDDFFSSITNMVDNFFSNDFFKGVTTGTSVPAVNIYEDNHGFDIEVAAPGFEKGDFKLNLDGGILTITGSKKSEAPHPDRKVTKKEFNYASFKRSFNLPNAVDTTNIKAKYEKGILIIRLPKLVESSSAGINIDID